MNTSCVTNQITATQLKQAKGVYSSSRDPTSELSSVILDQCYLAPDTGKHTWP